jgi:hypothetical protein
MGHSSLLVANAVPCGRVSGPAGLAPEALQERECSCTGFFRETLQRAGRLFQPASAMFQPASVRHTHTPGAFCVRCSLGGVAVRRAPEPGPVRGDRAELSDLYLYAPSPSLRGTEGEVSTTPIDRVADCGFLVELLSGNSSGRPCPVR